MSDWLDAFREKKRQALLALGLFLAVFFLALASRGGAPRVSVEARFTDAVPSGLHVVPASCPSNPHYQGECGGGSPGSPQMSAAPSCGVSGPQVTVSWSLDLNPREMTVNLSQGGRAAASSGNLRFAGQTGSYTFSGLPSGASYSPNASYCDTTSPTGPCNDSFVSGAPVTTSSSCNGGGSDVCPNIPGAQSSLPPGYVVDANGQCVLPFCQGGACQPPPPPSSGCVIYSSPTSISNGQSAQLAWNTGCSPAYGCSYLGVPITPANASITHVGSVGPSGVATVFPTVTTAYTLSGDYVANLGFFRVPLDSFACDAQVGVQGGGPYCPDGSPAPGGDVNKCPGQCSISDICIDAATLRHTSADCSVRDFTCPYVSSGFGCVSNGCAVPPPASVTDFSLKPGLVSKGATASVTWSSRNARSCVVSGGNGDRWSGTSGSVTTGPITSQTIYTLSCTGIDGTPISPQTATVNLVPAFEEK